MKKILIQNGTLVLPGKGMLVDRDILLEDGIVRRVGRGLTDPQAFRVNASGLLVGPGFINLHVHFREPGEEYKEDLRSGSRAAAMGGFTSVLCMPNTQPPVDEPMIVRYLRSMARRVRWRSRVPRGSSAPGRGARTGSPSSRRRSAPPLRPAGSPGGPAPGRCCRRACPASREGWAWRSARIRSGPWPPPGSLLPPGRR